MGMCNTCTQTTEMPRGLLPTLKTAAQETIISRLPMQGVPVLHLSLNFEKNIEH